jgi:predicted CXXCH cytochrome family protein
MTRAIAPTSVVVGLLVALTSRPAAAQVTAAAATEAYRDDVHASSGLTCAACHQNAGQAENAQARILPLPRTAIAPVCAKCHSDAAYMRQFAPQVRVDQFSQYLTSTHGKRMAAGEVRVATCSDCHGAHGIKRVNDARSSVAPVNVATTCGRCHGDAARMSAFGRAATPPTDWGTSVHAAALLKRGDTSAPTCNSCHGSHGAAPPGVTEVANVCAQCHVREAQLFRASPKKEIFDAIGQAECLVCHSNHKIESPADSWIGIEKGNVCEQCHDKDTNGTPIILEVRQQLDRLSNAIRTADADLARVEQAGMLVDDGRTALREAREHHVQARVLVHTFAAQPFGTTANQGVVAARRGEESAAAATRDLQIRRRGLAVATVVILLFLAGLWLKIRSLPPGTEDSAAL